ncbi:WD40/YVTN/BNR-like repeat-containing protein [Dictyobacter kobayashii]|uniref:Sortilin N-terminal domain-containing protein n=1 Tax=Dictyobacter kobayashii TaxID=2014872 RepID=A0A402AJP1_9CHLR|nr:YCF48-related protein [Dictyobacter kobayashii]GCE19289.1 hypothetical protein KDK_30890 [Dictyobacter kobayashii]
MHTSRDRKPWRARNGRILWSRFSFGLFIICILLALAGCGSSDNGNTNNTSLVPLPTPTPGPSQAVSLQTIHMLDQKNGWAITHDGRVLHTTQGTAKWRDITPTAGAPQPTFSTATFLDAQNAWITAQVNDKVSIWRTYTGGDFWLESPLPVSGQGVVNINFIDPLNGWLLLKTASAKANNEPVAVFSTTDGGNNWYQIDNAGQSSNASLSALPANNEKTGIGFKSTTQGWVTGYAPDEKVPVFYASNDAGYTWTAQKLTLPNERPVRTFAPVFFNQNDGILPAQLVDNSQGVVIYTTHDGGKTWSGNTPDANITSTVSFTSAAQGWAIGSNVKESNIYSTNDSGKTWSRLSQLGGDVAKIEDLQFVSATNGWAIATTKADTTQLYQSTDGGKSWAVVDTSASS